MERSSPVASPLSNILTFPRAYLTPTERIVQAVTELRLALDELANAWAACDQDLVREQAPEVDDMMSKILGSSDCMQLHPML